MQRKKTSGRAAGERLAWENTTLEKKLDRFAQSELHKVMQSALFSSLFCKKATCRPIFIKEKPVASVRRATHLFLATFFADQKIDCDGSGKPGLHTLTFFIFAQQHEGRQHPQDVQILTLDDAEADKRQTFRFEGSAEILELEHDQRQETGGTEVEEEEEDLNRLPRQRQALEVLQEEGEVEEDASSSPVGILPPPRNNSNLGQKLRSVASSSPASAAIPAASISSRATSSTSVDQASASDMMRKISDHKEQQTDITYGHVNKKVQADTMNAEDQNSDIDHDDTDEGEVSSSVLSQSIRYSST